uniref:Uncharacterized protein n=1 Tax=Opuntia streptacantha TaxID=393608 RepID=A0A7C8ZVF3_OPUST
MKKPPDPLLTPFPRPPQFPSQRQFSDLLVVSDFQLNFIASFSVSHHFAASRDAFMSWVRKPHPLIPPFPDPQHLPSSPLPCCRDGSLIVDFYRNQGQSPWFDSARRHLGTRPTSWVIGTAYLQGDLGTALSDPSVYKASMASVCVRALGAGEDQQRRSGALIGVMRKSGTQISLVC